MQKYVACNDVHSLDLELNYEHFVFFFFSVNGINHCSVIEQSEASKRAQGRLIVTGHLSPLCGLD